MAETTLREIIYKALEEVLDNEKIVLTSELKELTEYILNNSSLHLTSNKINMKNGNLLGVGSENKDKEICFPQFLLFKFKKRDIKNREGATWRLESYEDMERLEMELERCACSELRPAVFINNEIFKYNYDEIDECEDGFIEMQLRWVNWEQEIYSVSYELDNIKRKNRFRNRKKLEEHVKSIVNKRAKNIKVKNIIEDKEMGFSVTSNLYDTNAKEGYDYERSWILWQEPEHLEFWENIVECDF